MGGAFAEKCREICLAYGLLPTGHVANDARAYLEVAKPQELSADLATILNDREFHVAETQPHSLIGKSAPDFSLVDSSGNSRTLAELRNGKPLILVFYLGYGCSHCVAQLFGLDKDLRYFRELGCDVVAVSFDTPETTRQKYKEYGEFHFPVLSDPENKVAQKYGVFTPAKGDIEESLDHGTFVIDAAGKIIWANQGSQPFLDNKSLLRLVEATRKNPSDNLAERPGKQTGATN
ncbi:MAG: peroxiredoxin family protein [Planctomycetales bacterium]